VVVIQGTKWLKNCPQKQPKIHFGEAVKQKVDHKRVNNVLKKSKLNFSDKRRPGHARLLLVFKNKGFSSIKMLNGNVHFSVFSPLEKQRYTREKWGEIIV